MDEELDSLREKSTRASAVYDDLEGESASGGGGFLSKYSAAQKLILALLFFLDIAILACLILVVTGTIAI